MSEAEEQAWIQGERAAWRSILGSAFKALDVTPDEGRYIAEREDAIAVLRGLCRKFGDNEWDEKLHLADIIDKHLGRHLESDE